MLADVHGFFLGFFIFLFIVVCMFLILLVLIQKGRGGGLVSAFGGMGGNTAFGSKTGDVLTWATSIIFGIFLVLAIILNLLSGGTSNTGKTTPASGTPTNSTPAAPAGGGRTAPAGGSGATP